MRWPSASAPVPRNLPHSASLVQGLSLPTHEVLSSQARSFSIHSCQLKKRLYFLLCVCEGVHMCHSTHVEVRRQLCGGSRFSPAPTFARVPGMGLRSPGCQSKPLYPLIQLLSPSETMLEADTFLPNSKRKGWISDSQGGRVERVQVQTKVTASCLSVLALLGNAQPWRKQQGRVLDSL